MTKQSGWMDDIISNHSQRMKNLMKYYPFFKLWDNTLTQYKDGFYNDLDMPYIVLALIRFMIEEHNFNERSIDYRMIQGFLYELLARDFKLQADEADKEALIAYIFDKICNEGRPFSCTYFDPAAGERRTLRMRLIESVLCDGRITYRLSSDAIDFYLSTKEVREESKISIEQVLLSKMVASKNFSGALEVINRINSEISRLIASKDEIIELLGSNVFEGVKALADFSENGMKWFKEEQEQFSANKALVDRAMEMASDKEARAEIYEMDVALKKAMDSHSRLLFACTGLQEMADEMIQRAKHSQFRASVDFIRLKQKLKESDNMEALSAAIKPLFAVKLLKTFNLEQLDDMLSYKPEERLLTEAVQSGSETAYAYADDLAEARIQNNFDYLLKVLFDQLIEKDKVDLVYMNHLYMMKFGEELYRNGDYYAFIAHLSQKSSYDIDRLKETQDTFMEGAMAAFLKADKGGKYDGLKFRLIFDAGRIVDAGETAQMTNIRFERMGG